MNPTLFFMMLLAAPALCGAPAIGQTDTSRTAALDYLGRGTTAFRAGDLIAATRDWSEAIRLCRLNGATDLEAQALARRGEAYRVQGHLRDASSDLQAALAKAEQSNDRQLIAASSGALGNLAFASRRTAVAEPLLKRSRDLAAGLHDPAIMAASENDLGNLYATTDVIHASAFMDLVRQLVRCLDYQVIMSTHDSAEAAFLVRKCQSAKIPFVVHELLPPGNGGLISEAA
jgi:tetratricopeptide (TPR) repeat protein